MRQRRTARTALAALAVSGGILATSFVGTVAAASYTAWGPAVNAETPVGTSSQLNTASLDGCPMQSPDGLSLYFASNRAGTLGGLDIWVAHRSTSEGAFGDPVHLGAPINSAADDFCPTPVRGGGLFFVSAREGGCGPSGTADIYFTRLNPSQGWTTPANLGCQANGGPNGAGGEASPSYFEADGQAYLYFSSGPDIMASIRQPDGSFGPAFAVTELNTSANEFRPNVSKNGLEIVFDSNRPGTVGSQDLYFATRASVSDPWSTPVNAGSNLNTADAEIRGSFSWDATTLYFGRNPGPDGGMDLFFSTRDRAGGG